MLTCKEASFLASKKMDDKLAWRERMALLLHVSLCKLCRRYLNGLEKLRKLMRKAGDSGNTYLPDNVTLSAQDRKRIEQALQKAAKQLDDQ